MASYFNSGLVASFTFIVFFLYTAVDVFSNESFVKATMSDNLFNESRYSNQTFKDNSESKIALVENKFTYAAYQNGSFYNFYSLYSPQLYGNSSSYLDQNWTNFVVKKNLDFLTDRPIPDGPFRYYSYPQYLTIPYKFWYDYTYETLKNYSSHITNLTDMDVDRGKIFLSNGSNAFDVLFLFHNEYVTQTEYDNLKKFVGNGGTLVFTQANALFAQTSYNQSTNSISLVNGHSWRVDDHVAKGSLSERWAKESKDWIGSNFLDIPSNYQVYFRNNPFDMVHNEEAYITNPNASILIDYNAFNLTKKYYNATVGAYVMDYQKGRVIHMGIWSHTVYTHPLFEEFFKNVVLSLAINGVVQDTPLYNSFLAKRGDFILNKISPECVSFDQNLRIITIFCDLSLTQLYNTVNDDRILNRTTNGDLLLNSSIVVNADSTLYVSNNDTTHLKILKNENKPPNHITVRGQVVIDGVKITSWDPNLMKAITQNDNGTVLRPFIVFEDATSMQKISNSEFSYLGYNLYPRNGVVFDAGLHGGYITNTTFHHLWDGFFSDSAKNLILRDNKFFDNHRYGINPHSSHDVELIGNMIRHNGLVGIALSAGSSKVSLLNNSIGDNHLAGISLTSDTSNSTILQNHVYREEIGVNIESSSNNVIMNNNIDSSNTGLLLKGSSNGNYIVNNTIGI